MPTAALAFLHQQVVICMDYKGSGNSFVFLDVLILPPRKLQGNTYSCQECKRHRVFFLKKRYLDSWWNCSLWVLWRNELKSLWHYGRECLICQTVSFWWTRYLVTWCCTNASRFLVLSAWWWCCQRIVTRSNYCKCKTLPINTIDGQFVFSDYQTSIGLSVVCVLHGETSGWKDRSIGSR